MTRKCTIRQDKVQFDKTMSNVTMYYNAILGTISQNNEPYDKTRKVQ